MYKFKDVEGNEHYFESNDITMFSFINFDEGNIVIMQIAFSNGVSIRAKVDEAVKFNLLKEESYIDLMGGRNE